MSGRAKARREAMTDREYILFSRLQAGDCTFCPRHDGENMRGEHSRWGKKRAAKNYYVTGRGRKAPKTFRTGYTYKNYGIDLIPKRQSPCVMMDKGWMCEYGWETKINNKTWKYREY